MFYSTQISKPLDLLGVVNSLVQICTSPCKNFYANMSLGLKSDKWLSEKGKCMSYKLYK